MEGAGRESLQRNPHGAGVRPEQEQDAADGAGGEDLGPTSTWKRNERLVYLANFLHMTMYTMCLGSVFDIFTYNLSQDHQNLITNPVQIGSGVKPPPPMYVDTYSDYELMFEIWPRSDMAGYKSNSSCRKLYTCGTSLMHITDGTGNGDCCRVGNRMPFIFLDNRSTKMQIAMDAEGQNESMNVMDYDKLQKCSMSGELPVEVWSSIKVKVSGREKSKGQFNKKKGEPDDDDGGVILMVNGVKACEVLGTRYHVLPAKQRAHVYLGSLQPPSQDVHVPANAYVRNVKYGKPASNLLVGQVNSVQGIVAVLLMYPIGWAGDHLNRYGLVQANMLLGFCAAALMIGAVTSRNITAIYAGVVLFTFYQQCISSIIYAILADNVVRERRTRAGVNYKTFSTLAQALGVAVQLVVVLVDPSEDSWTVSTFNLMLLPGWGLLPIITLAVIGMLPVGQKLGRPPNVDEVREVARAQTQRLNQTWLDEIVCCGQRRRFVVAAAANAFFILTLLANGMTVRYFPLYFTQIKKFSPAKLCLLNTVCRLWIALFAQVGKPLSRKLGRCNLVVLLHVSSSLFTLGIYGGGLFEPGIWAACASYLMRYACLQTRDPLLYSITMDCVPQSQRARWAALNSLRTLSFAASAVVGGYLSDMYGYQFSFNITVVLLLAGLVFFLPAWIWFPRREGEGAEGSECLVRGAAPPSSSPGTAVFPSTAYRSP